MGSVLSPASLFISAFSHCLHFLTALHVWMFFWKVILVQFFLPSWSWTLQLENFYACRKNTGRLSTGTIAGAMEMRHTYLRHFSQFPASHHPGSFPQYWYLRPVSFHKCWLHFSLSQGFGYHYVHQLLYSIALLWCRTVSPCIKWAQNAAILSSSTTEEKEQFLKKDCQLSHLMTMSFFPLIFCPNPPGKLVNWTCYNCFLIKSQQARGYFGFSYFLKCSRLRRWGCFGE